MYNLIGKIDQKVMVKEIVDACYKEERKALKQEDKEAALNLIMKIRALVSDIRKKLLKNGINPEIISSLSQESTIIDIVTLQVHRVENEDEKHL